MTPWQNERWAGTPTNDGRNFAPAHRWAVMEPRPLCFGWRRIVGPAAGLRCGNCSDWTSRWCYVAYKSLRNWASPEARTSAMLRSYIREAHELREEVSLLNFMAFEGPFSRRELSKRHDELRHYVATLEAENAALRGKLPRCPDCGHRLDTEERGCARADAGAIQTDDECNAALVRIEKLWGAKTGTPDGDVLDVLLDSVVAYEAAHHLVPGPDKGGDA